MPSPRLSFHREGRWGTTDDFTTNFLHLSLFSTALSDLANSRPVHSLMLSSHLLICLSCLLSPFTLPCKMVLTRPDKRETCPYHCSLRLFTMIRTHMHRLKKDKLFLQWCRFVSMFLITHDKQIVDCGSVYLHLFSWLCRVYRSFVEERRKQKHKNVWKYPVCFLSI